MSAKTWTVWDNSYDKTTVEIDDDLVHTRADMEEMWHTPASARELAAALIEAADLVEGVKRDVVPVPDLTDPQTFHRMFDMLAQAYPAPKPEATPVPDHLADAVEQLIEIAITGSKHAGLNIERARKSLAAHRAAVDGGER